MSRSRSADPAAAASGPRRPWRHPVAWPLALALLLIGLAWWPGGPLRPLEDALYDLRLRWLAPATADPQVVVIDIDERALAAHGRWPWPRRQLADLLRAAVDQGGARLVGLDLVLAQPDQSSGLAAVDRLAQGPLRGDPGFQALWQNLRPQLDDDRQLADVLQQHPVVLGFHLSNEAGAAQVGALPAPLLPTSVLGPAAAALPDWAGHGGNLAALQQAARLGGGHLNAILDADGTVRRVPLLVQYQSGVHPTLALAMARVLLGAPGEPATLLLQPADGPLQALYLRGLGGRLRVPVDARAHALVPFHTVAAAPQRLSAADLLAGTLPADALRGKAVLVGVSAPGLIDQRRTPMDEAMLGTLVHAELLSGLLQQRVVGVPPLAPALQAAGLLALAGVLGWSLPRLALWQGAALTAGLMAASLLLNLLAWQQLGWVLPLAASLLLPPLLLAGHLVLAYRRANGARRQLAQLFGQYVPPELVDEKSRSPERYGMVSRNATLTVLFADVSGFTATAQRMPPAELGAMMNLLFSHLTDVVRDHRGTLDKYIGDALMAFWGAPLDDPDHARHAVAAALAMQARLPAIHAEMAARGWPALRLNIGINTGTVVVGDMGSRHRRAYTVLGDAVNLAARLQAFSSQHGLGLVVGDATHAALGSLPCLPLGSLPVRGRDVLEPVWQPLSPPPDGPADPAAVTAAWLRMQAAAQGGRPADAVALLETLQHQPGLDALCRWQREALQTQAAAASGSAG